MNKVPAVGSSQKERDSIFSISDEIRERQEIGVCITGFNLEDKHVNCPDKISCPGVRMFINPDNENQYFCPKCGDTIDVNQAVYKKGIKPSYSDNNKENNTFIIAQQDKKIRDRKLDELADMMDDADLKAMLGESAYLVDEWES